MTNNFFGFYISKKYLFREVMCKDATKSQQLRLNFLIFFQWIKLMCRFNNKSKSFSKLNVKKGML